jgi:predicted nucleic acid-binding protein
MDAPLADTNIVSELARKKPDPAVLRAARRGQLALRERSATATAQGTGPEDGRAPAG